MTADAVPAAPDTRRMFGEFAETTAPRAPLYSRLSRAIADDPDLLALLDAAPPTQRQPVLLFAAVHDLVLGEPDAPLARWYPNLHDPPDQGDPAPVFRDFCLDRRDALRTSIGSRSTQTNEVGRSAVFLPALALLADEVGPLGLIDVGTSAGLNLLLPHYGYRYRPGGEVGDLDGVVIDCGVRGPAPIPDAVPPIPHAVGLDRSPIDVTDATATRWLEACVWPDQPDRFERLRGALAMAAAAAAAGDHDVRRGDAVEDTPALVHETAAHGVHPVVTNSWVLSYLTTEQRQDYVAALDAAGRDRDLSWVFAESPALTPGLPRPDDDPALDITVLSMARWRSGRRTVRHLATCHPHGYWLHWRE